MNAVTAFKKTVIDNTKVGDPKKNVSALDEYFLFPIKSCKIDDNKITKAPYNTAKWKQKYDNGYDKDIFTKDGKMLPTEPYVKKKEKDFKSQLRYRNMVIYKKGGEDFFEIFQRLSLIRTFKSDGNIIVDDIIDFAKKLINVGKGIQLLQKYGYIHGDIKDTNIIEIDGKLKLIDLTDLRDISETRDSKSMPFAFGYYAWPSISFYTIFFDEKYEKTMFSGEENKKTLDSILENKEELLYHLIQYYDKNYEYYYGNLKQYLYDPFMVTKNNGFVQDEFDRIREIAKKLYLQKMLGMFGSDEKKLEESFSDDNEYIKFIGEIMGLNGDNTDNAHDIKKVEKLLSQINYYSDIFKDFSTIEEFKMDLFKRIDVYSFGILILGILRLFVVRYNDQVIPVNIRRLMIILYEIAYVCCYQDDVVSNIDAIIPRYDAILKEF